MYILWNIENEKKYYKHQTEQITKTKRKKSILCDFTIQIDRKMKSFKPDIVVNDY